MAKAGPIDGSRLKSFIERIEKLEEERHAIGGDIRDVYSEAKGVGYDVGIMRKIVQERKKDAADRDEQEALLAVYRRALGMASYRSVAEQFGISKSKLHRLVPREQDGTGEGDQPEPPHDCATGEILASGGSDASGGGAPSITSEAGPAANSDDMAIPSFLRRVPA